MVVDPADHNQATSDAMKQKLTGPDSLTLAKLGNDKIKAELIAKPYELSGGAALGLAAAISRLAQSAGLVSHSTRAALVI